MSDLSLISQDLEKLAQTPPKYRKINTFMKRRTHISQTASAALIDDKYGDYIINQAKTVGHLGDASQITDLRTLFDAKDNPLILEIGFGMGDSLIEMAKNSPNSNFVGIEVHEAGIGRTAYLAYELGLKNLKLINGDAIALLNALPQGHLDQILLFFPDPWQKKRHYKRRFVTPDRMAAVHHALKQGGIFHSATDWEHYAFWMLEVLDNLEGFRNLYGQGNFAPRPDSRPFTKFEKRGIESGHGVWDLIYKKI